MPIQWYPGHMAKAMRTVQENLKLVDVVIEVVDARCPGASSNGDLVRLLQAKPRIVVLNKADLADPPATEDWIGYLRASGVEALPFDAAHGQSRPLLQAIGRVFQPALQAWTAKGRRPRAARVMVAGIPNVGKSSLINRLVGTRRAATGNKPGITRGKQWVRVGAGIELLDLPGIMPPRFDSQEAALLLAAVGVVKEEVFDPVEAAGALLPVLFQKVPGGLGERLGLTELQGDTQAGLARVAQARGLLLQGGGPDLQKAALLLLRECREGRLGRMTLEEPPVVSSP
jgi:ribosome biogenesis GTPase A